MKRRPSESSRVSMAFVIGIHDTYGCCVLAGRMLLQTAIDGSNTLDLLHPGLRVFWRCFTIGVQDLFDPGSSLLAGLMCGNTSAGMPLCPLIVEIPLGHVQVLIFFFTCMTLANESRLSYAFFDILPLVV